MTKLTPMMQQYMEIKEQYNDCILFFRLGDFYEMFFSDAKTASRELEIALTGRECGLGERAPMCGVPFHSSDSYISKLVDKGYKVAICEQVGDPVSAKGLVKREVIRVVTPGTVTDITMLDERKNNYLMSIYKRKCFYGVAFVDLTTGEFFSTNITFGNTTDKLMDEIAKFSPSEVVINKELQNDGEVISKLKKRFNLYISNVDEGLFCKDYSIDKIKKYFQDHEVEEDTIDLFVNASGALLGYLEQTQKANLGHIRNFNMYKVEEYMVLDLSTRRNLELTETMREKSRRGSVLWVLDRTITSMGGRKLRKWIEQPLINIHDINDRLQAVSEFKEKYMLRMELRELLKLVYDIERLMSKIILGSANCRDLISIKTSIGQVPHIKALMEKAQTSLNAFSYNQLDDLSDIYELIERSLVDEPPVSVKEGGIIKVGYNKEIDRLKSASKDGRGWILELESREKERTGIKNLKVGFNRVFGYYIEITKSYYSQVPKDYIRKQTLANCERYITQELKEIEDTVLDAEDKLTALEYAEFVNIRDKIAKEITRMKQTAHGLSRIDVLCSLAEVADRESYVMPQITEDGQVKICDGRHPVVEKMVGQGEFVPNDTHLNTKNDQIAIITGPNMAGKSTYLRQVALIVLMAQIGSFVPAQSAYIGIVDRIFTRVGASDDLASGQSTFMVEMSEVANILKNATSKSLLILDEIGRGTSTYDGLSIAWSVIEFLSEKIGAKTLFATHYHELTELEEEMDSVKNYCISVKEEGEDIIFLRKILRGGANNSYGVQVARLAGVPDMVIVRANELLKELKDADIAGKKSRPRKGQKVIGGQLDVFSFNAAQRSHDKILNEIKSIDVSTLTPLDALNMIYNLQKKIRE